MAIAIAICRYSYVFGVGGSNITGEINYPLLHSVLQIQRGDTIFQRDPNNNIRKFCSGGSKNFNKNETDYPGVDIFGPGKLKWGGTFRVTGLEVFYRKHFQNLTKVTLTCNVCFELYM